MLAGPGVLPVEKPRLYLHLGVHKTATTSLQVLIEHNALALATQGVLTIPREHGTCKALIGQKDADSWNYQTDFKRRFRKLVRTQTRRKKYRRLLALSTPTLAAFSASTSDLLISDEDLLGRQFGEKHHLYPDAERHIKVLRNIFPNHEARVILYLREQASFVESCYIQKVQTGFRGSFDDYLSGVNLEHLDWFGLAKRIARVVGPNNLSIRSFSSMSGGSMNGGFDAFAFEFFEHFSDPSKLDLYSVHTNPSLSGPGIAVARRLAPLLPLDYWKKVRPLLQRALSSRYLPRAHLMDDNQRQVLSARYAGDIERTVRQYPGNRETFGPRRLGPS